MILVIDNYDSFTYNICQYIGELQVDIRVVRNDEINIDEIKAMGPLGIVLSPGPGVPENAGICIEVIRELGRSIPILGICLGHQAIGYAYGGKIVRASVVKHGKTSVIRHENDRLFRGAEEEIRVMRYHSLVVDEEALPKELIVTAKSLDDGAIMAMKHKDYDVYGVQFHPESIFTENGKDMIRNFIMEVCNVTESN
ncbi:MAG TPA: aminodeoxychorismate/anthranilate synthase component II [Clostridiaceae bacterium]|nr:aminodeoxychorismate/anthranilate synthase component II [Clostridiaceae bacterium]